MFEVWRWIPFRMMNAQIVHSKFSTCNGMHWFICIFGYCLNINGNCSAALSIIGHSNAMNFHRIFNECWFVVVVYLSLKSWRCRKHISKSKQTTEIWILKEMQTEILGSIPKTIRLYPKKEQTHMLNSVPFHIQLMASLNGHFGLQIITIKCSFSGYLKREKPSTDLQNHVTNIII